MLLAVFAILFAALLHEDVAIATGAFLVVTGDATTGWALAAILTGVLINNFSLFVLGTFARRFRWRRSAWIHARAEGVGAKLREHAVAAVLLCRLAPGGLTTTCVGCGWLGVRLNRFALPAVAAATLYVMLMFSLVTTFGHIAVNQWSQWPWVAMATLVTVALVAVLRWRAHPNRARAGMLDAGSLPAVRRRPERVA